MLGAATSVFMSASDAVVTAHKAEPNFDILVTGASTLSRVHLLGSPNFCYLQLYKKFCSDH